MTSVKIGILLPTRGIILENSNPQNSDLIIHMAELAEESSLDSVWVGDSLSAKPRMEPLSTLSAISSRTKKVRLGTSVLLAALRNPVMLSQAINTLDLLSSGRAVIALGAGGAFIPSQVKEWEIAGVDVSTRGKRLEEVVHVIKLLESNFPVTFKGQFFQLDNVTIHPKPVQTDGVPILFACHTRAKREAQFKRAALLGNGLISISESPLEFAQAIQKVKAYSQEYDRSVDNLEAAFYMTVNIDHNEQRALENSDAFINMYYGINIWQNLWGPWGSPKSIANRINEYTKAGATTIIVRFASLDPITQLKLFINEVIPQLN